MRIKYIQQFVAVAGREGAATALARGIAPAPSQRFMQVTFGFIATGKPHVVAAAFSLGREQVIPGMFRSLLKEMQIGKTEVPTFQYYLERHIYLDEDHHGPLSLLMLNELCAGDSDKLKEAEHAARAAIRARIEFWDGVQDARWVLNRLAPRVGPDGRPPSRTRGPKPCDS